MNKDEFFLLEKQLIDAGVDADLDSFQAIKKRLKEKAPLSADEFARNAIYVVLAGGFSQKTAKKKHTEIMKFFSEQSTINNELLLHIFNNKNKINAIIKIWLNRQTYRDDYYKLTTLEERLKYIATLPHIGKITANHLARNLGENVWKRDVWLDRLLKQYGEDLLERLEVETGLPRGYIDVVLWKSCQTGLIKLKIEHRHSASTNV